MSTLPLFPEPRADEHPVALAALASGAVLSVSVSGGKDSQAMLSRLAMLRTSYRWPGYAEAIHADLGRAEWPQTPEHVERIVAEAGLPLVVVRRAGGDLVDRIEARMNTVSTVDPTRPAKPFWPSAAQRYCTSDLKRGPIQKHTRTHGSAVIVSAQGMRAAESSARAKRPTLIVDKALTSRHLLDTDDDGKPVAPPPAVALERQRAHGGRLLLTWLVIRDWSDEAVWRELGTSLADLDERRQLYAGGAKTAALRGWQAHPAYVFGNERLSCSLCVLACRSDLVNGARHNPDLLARYLDLEERSGYTFRDGLSLAEIAAEAALTPV